MPRVGGQDFSAAELRAYFVANNPLRKAPEAYSASYVRRVASAQLRGESAGLAVSRQVARRGAAPERPGRPTRQAPSLPRFIRQVVETAKGRFKAAGQRTGRQVGDTLREFLRAGVERVKIVGYFTEPDGRHHAFEIGSRGGYRPETLRRMIADAGGWPELLRDLLEGLYGGMFSALDLDTVELLS